ncbi:tol-pal system protein YbgF [bacterium]|nr:tol-pal system protein YbgF [bacterium]
MTQLDESVQKQQKNLKDAVEQVDRNASEIRNTTIALEDIQKRLTEIENKLNSSATSENTQVQEMKENLAFLNDQVLRIDNSLRTSRPATTPKPKAPSAFKPGGFQVTQAYEAARTEYEARRYESAISGFNEVLTVTPNSNLADNAQYWIGECYYSIGNFEKALDAFTKVFNYPESNKLPDAHYKVAKTYLKLGKTDAAKEEYKTVIQNYPGTNAAEYARSELTKLGE